MKQFKIMDEVNAQVVAIIPARDGRSALKKFRDTRIFSSGMTEILKTPKGNYELCTSYGAYFYACPHREAVMASSKIKSFS